MRVPNRKPGEFTKIIPDPYITLDKFNKLKAERQKLKTLLPQAVAEVQRLSETGDYSENAAYQMSKSRLRNFNQRLLDLNDQLKMSIIIKPKHQNKVQLGSRVKVNIDGQLKTYLILGSSEIDLKNNTISHNSPMGFALMSKKVGDTVSLKLTDQEIKMEIIKID